MLKKYMHHLLSQINTIQFISEHYIGNQLPAANKKYKQHKENSRKRLIIVHLCRVIKLWVFHSGSFWTNFKAGNGTERLVAAPAPKPSIFFQLYPLFSLLPTANEAFSGWRCFGLAWLNVSRKVPLLEMHRVKDIRQPAAFYLSQRIKVPIQDRFNYGEAVVELAHLPSIFFLQDKRVKCSFINEVAKNLVHLLPLSMDRVVGHHLI